MPNSEKVENFLNKYLQDYHREEEKSSIKELNFYGGNYREILKNEELDLNDFVNLEELKCGGNELAELDVSKCSELKKLSCFRNRLTSLNLSGNPALTELNCNLNELTTLDLTNNPNLEVVEVQLNKIVADLNIFSHLNKLRVLKLGKKLVSESQSLEENKFFGSLKALENCQDLEELYLTCQSEIDEGHGENLKFLPIAKLTVFECEDTEFWEVIKLFSLGKGNDVYSLFAYVLIDDSGIWNSTQKSHVSQVFQDLIQAKKDDYGKDGEISDLNSEISNLNNEIAVLKKSKPASQNSKILIIIAVIGWVISSIFAACIWKNYQNNKKYDHQK